MRQVEQIMSMPISIDIIGVNKPAIFKAAFDQFRQIEQRFSRFLAGSEVSIYNQGGKHQFSDEFSFVQRACATWHKATDGYFSAYYNGTYDPLGYVKGWAIGEVAKSIEATGAGTYFINAGGDILARSDSDKTWQIGLQHPLNKHAIIAKLAAKNIAVATSGSYVRGQHIVNPKTKKPAHSLLSVSVYGADIITADVLATALFARDKNDLSWVVEYAGYQAIIVGNDGLISVSHQ